MKEGDTVKHRWLGQVKVLDLDTKYSLIMIPTYRYDVPYEVKRVQTRLLSEI